MIEFERCKFNTAQKKLLDLQENNDQAIARITP